MGNSSGSGNIISRQDHAAGWLAVFRGSGVFSKSVFGARLCPQGQPQHVNHSETSAANGVLRLVSDTAALRARFENTPKSLIQKLSGSLKIFDQSIWPSATPATINTIAVQNVGVIGSPSA